MPKAKPISLHPLSFDEAIKAIIKVDPHHTETEKGKLKKKEKAAR